MRIKVFVHVVKKISFDSQKKEIVNNYFFPTAMRMQVALCFLCVLTYTQGLVYYHCGAHCTIGLMQGIEDERDASLEIVKPTSLCAASAPLPLIFEYCEPSQDCNFGECRIISVPELHSTISLYLFLLFMVAVIGALFYSVLHNGISCRN